MQLHVFFCSLTFMFSRYTLSWWEGSNGIMECDISWGFYMKKQWMQHLAILEQFCYESILSLKCRGKNLEERTRKWVVLVKSLAWNTSSQPATLSLSHRTMLFGYRMVHYCSGLRNDFRGRQHTPQYSITVHTDMLVCPNTSTNGEIATTSNEKF